MADDQRPHSPDLEVARDTDGRGSENQRSDLPRDPNEEAVTDAFNAGGDPGDGPDAVDLQDLSGASRREPGH